MNRCTAILGTGNTIVIAASTADTGGRLALLDHELAPGFVALPLHVHTAEDAAVYVLEGTLLARQDLGERLLEAGAFIFLPRGTAHALSNPSLEPARFLMLLIPAGFEQCLADLDTLLETGAPWASHIVVAALARYGVRLVPVAGPAPGTLTSSSGRPRSSPARS